MTGNPTGCEIEKCIALADKQETLAVIALDSTRSGSHVITVTGKDKSIRVFEHDGKGQLQHISQR